MASVEAVAAIQATLAPVFLISGAGIFLNFTQNRLFRVTDRLRDLVDRAKAAEGEEREFLLSQKRLFLQRGMLLRNAITFGVVTLALTVLTAALLLESAFLAPLPSGLTLAVFGLALVSFMGSLAFALRDTFLSLTAVREEVVRAAKSA